MIKFRAWHDGEMYKVLSIECFCEYLKIINKNSLRIHRGFDDVELMQYTGYKDINDAEIYEGDILKAANGEMGIMTKNNGEWVALHKSGVKLINNRYYDYTEIIGNIYENKDLLNA